MVKCRCRNRAGVGAETRLVPHAGAETGLVPPALWTYRTGPTWFRHLRGPAPSRHLRPFPSLAYNTKFKRGKREVNSVNPVTLRYYDPNSLRP
eukprot:3733012-Amphidinium_carterae.1